MGQYSYRKSLRLKEFDYRQPGGYFVTIVTKYREFLFGEMDRENVRLNHIGALAAGVWQALPAHFPVKLDAWVVLPNHLHGIFFLETDRADVENENCLPGSVSGSFNAIIQNFKSISTIKINRARRTPGTQIWQRNYYESVIRDDHHLENLRGYITDNGLRHFLKTNHSFDVL